MIRNGSPITPLDRALGDLRRIWGDRAILRVDTTDHGWTITVTADTGSGRTPIDVITIETRNPQPTGDPT